MASLTAIKGANQGTTLPLEGDQIILGRNAECQVVINLPAVSREHALIRKVQNQYWIEDLKSRNGTQINSLDIKKSTLLKHNDKIKICDNIFEFQDKVMRPPLPPDLTGLRPPTDEDEEDNSSSAEATISQISKQILETQPAEKLAVLLGIAADLTQTIFQDQLLPKIVDSLFLVFKQADRGFVIFREEDPDRLVPKVIRTRRANEESTARFSKGIIRKCLETGQALLSEDASADKQFDLSQSIADCRIRSVMQCRLPLAMHALRQGLRRHSGGNAGAQQEIHAGRPEIVAGRRRPGGHRGRERPAAREPDRQRPAWNANATSSWPIRCS